jgi:hypothetical protein
VISYAFLVEDHAHDCIFKMSPRSQNNRCYPLSSFTLNLKYDVVISNLVCFEVENDVILCTILKLLFEDNRAGFGIWMEPDKNRRKDKLFCYV